MTWIDAKRIGTVTVELTYEDALRLWVLVHAPHDAGQRPDIDSRIQKIVADAIKVTEAAYSPTDEGRLHD